MLQQDLPAVNQRVDVWFDGYDDYYGGRVESVARPYKFHVVLDDDSKWNLDTRKHVFQLSSPANQSEDQSNTVVKSPPVRRASSANARKSVGSKPVASDVGTPGSVATRRTRSRRASAPDPSSHLGLDSTSLSDAVDTPADTEKDGDNSSRRRTSGRALRKNTAGPRPPPPDPVESSPSGSSFGPAAKTRTGPRTGTRAGAVVADEEEDQVEINIDPAPTVSLIDDVDDVDKSTQEPGSKAIDKTFSSAAAAALAADAADERDNKPLGAVSFIKDSTDPSVLSSVQPNPAPPVSHSSFLSSFSLHPPPLLSPPSTAPKTPPSPAPKTPPSSTRRTSSRTATASPVKPQQESPHRSDGEPQSGGNVEVDTARGSVRTRSVTQTRSLAVGTAQDEVVPSLPVGRRKRGPPTMSDSASDDDASKSGRLRSTKKRRLVRSDVGGVANDGDIVEGSEASLTASPPVSPANVPSPTRRRSSVTFRDEVEVFPTPRYEPGNVKAKASMANPVTGEKQGAANAVAGSDCEIDTECENDVGSSDMLGSGIEQNGHSNTLENVSAKVITALAVDAALEAVKTVVEPLNERVENLLRELSSVSRDLVSQKKQLESELSSTISALNTIAEASVKADAKEQEEQVPPGPRKVAAQPAAAAARGVSASDPKEKGKMSGISQAVTISALQNFQLDISEVIGGGEARLRMHASLSHQEFESLHRLIEHQGKSLAELDRLLYAAQKFARKADDLGNDTGIATTTANGNGNGLDAGRTKDVSMDVDKESGGK